MTLNNFIIKFDADCWDPIWISLPAMMYFTGWTIGSLWLPALGDKYGRKVTYVICSFGTFLMMLALLFLQSTK